MTEPVPDYLKGTVRMIVTLHSQINQDIPTELQLHAQYVGTGENIFHLLKIIRNNYVVIIIM